MTSAWGDHEENTGFFKYYNDLWEEDLLGPKPHPHALDLFQQDGQGAVIRYANKPKLFRYQGCVNNPHWRQLLKASVRAGVETGFDGFMVQFPYCNGPCGSRFCQEKFRLFLRQKYAPSVLRRKFAIRDIDEYVFHVTVATPAHLELEAREFGAISVKECFDEVFRHYGRRLKPDLVVSMWTHMSGFLQETADNTRFASLSEERALLPIELWGKGENYLWYCSSMPGGRLKDRIVGDQTLQWKYCRAMAGRTPTLIQKYDRDRWRLTAAEALAMGGVVFGVWPGVSPGGGEREAIHLRGYFDFIRTADKYLSGSDSYAEGALLFPRTALYCGDATFFEPVRRLGRGLLEGHVLFDVLIDEKMTPAVLKRYRFIFIPSIGTSYLTSSQETMLDDYIQAGGSVLVLSTGKPPKDRKPPTIDSRGRRIFRGDLKNKQAIATAVHEAAGDTLSKFDTTWAVQVHAEQLPDRRRIVLHFVNYDRNEEMAPKEAPITAEPVGVDLRLPPGARVTGVRFLTPEAPEPKELEFTQSQDRLRFRSPRFLVYAVAAIQYK